MTRIVGTSFRGSQTQQGNACHLSSSNANARRCGIGIPAREKGRPPEICEPLWIPLTEQKVTTGHAITSTGCSIRCRSIVAENFQSQRPSQYLRLPPRKLLL